MKTEAQTRLTALGAGIDALATQDNLGSYPPTETIKLIGPGKAGPAVGATLGANNGKNVGIETVYVALRLKGTKVSVEGFEAEDALGNTDSDMANGMVPEMAKPDFYEYLDPWNNPYVYFHNGDYKSPQKVERYVKGDGTEVKAVPRMKANGEFVRPSSFQLFSMGPDGTPNTDDDLVYQVQ